MKKRLKTESAPVWAKKELSDEAKRNAAFCAGRDVASRPMADAALIPYDIACSTAHNVMLFRQGIFTLADARAILSALREVEDLWAKGRFELNPEMEDVHINIESYVARRCGIESGGKMHTGRSRNDQAACDMRLYLREQALSFHAGCGALVESLIRFGCANSEVLMPGFTHRQHGAISTVGHWALGHAEALGRDLERFRELYSRVNRNPLGAAAGYGTSWPIDRKLTTNLLGFDALLENSLDAVSSRGEAENEFACTISLLMNHLSRLAEDLIFFTTEEAAFFRLADAFVTGSSIMPQKRNPDLCEVIQAKASFAHGAVVSLLSLTKGILSGYDREMQWTKYTALDITSECLPAAELLARAIDTLEVDEKRLLASAGTGFLEAVDLADWLARERGFSFREGYKVSAASVEACRSNGKLTLDAVNRALPAGCKVLSQSEFDDVVDLRKCLSRRDHLGAPSSKNVKASAGRLAAQLAKETRWKDNAILKLTKAQQDLRRTVEEIIDS